MNSYEQICIQENLRRYLKSYRIENNLNAEEAAKLLGYFSVSSYRALESIKPHKKLCSGLELLIRLSGLSNHSVISFLKYLEVDSYVC